MYRTSMAITPESAEFAPLLFAGQWELGLQTAVELGYDGIEISLRDPAADVVKQLVDAVRASPLVISSIATGQSYYNDGLSLASPDASVRARLLGRLKAIVDIAASWSALVIIGGVRGVLEGSAAEQHSQRDYAMELVQRLAEYAAAASVHLVVEPINRYETNFLNTVQETLEFIDALGSDNVGVLADTFHMNIEEVSIPQALESAGARLGHVHLVDSNRRAPGQGHIDFAACAAALRRTGYAGYLCAEILPWPDSRQAASWAREFYRQM